VTMGTFLEPALEQAVKLNPETPSRFRTGQQCQDLPKRAGRRDPTLWSTGGRSARLARSSCSWR
jgi:hypothetical protein